MKAFLVLMLAAIAITAGDVRLDRPLPVGSTDELFQYDDGSAYWLSWGGLYRGVWFHQADFGFMYDMLDHLEFWFYHHASYPWDTASFYGAAYDGAAAGPSTMLQEISVTAVHYAPCYADFPQIDIGQDFWGLVDTELSSGGWPSILGDNSPNPTSHSFFSDDFVTWQPWIVGGATANDFFLRADVTWDALDQSTWGVIKTLF